MRKHIWKIDLVLVLVSVGVLMVLVGYAQPLVIAPLDEYESQDGEILFEMERADVLLIDDNIEFSSPEEYSVVGNEKVRLEPGVYYWKVVGFGVSEIRTFTINSRVELELVETMEGMAVINAGNVRLNVDVYDGDELVEKKKLGIGEASLAGDKFFGGYDE